MVLLIILAIFISLIIWLVFAPISIYIDTSRDEYYVRQPVTFKFQVIGTIKVPRYRLVIFGIPFKPMPFSKKQKKGKRKKKGQYKKGGVSLYRMVGSPRRIFRIISKLLHSFKLREFYLDLDTGDVADNAWLFPISYLMNRYNLNMHVNYDGDVILVMKVSNRLSNFILFISRFYLLKRSLK